MQRNCNICTYFLLEEIISTLKISMPSEQDKMLASMKMQRRYEDRRKLLVDVSVYRNNFDCYYCFLGIRGSGKMNNVKRYKIIHLL